MARPGLGPNPDDCTTQFVEAMRARLNAMDPPQGNNVDDPEVQKNFAALGQAVYQIATALAAPTSDSAEDAAFWDWVADVQAWLLKLSTWQAGVAQAFTTWAPATAPETSLRNLVRAVPAPGAPPATAPTRLKGRIE